MTKTKAQLRAEAVERLKDCRYHTLADYVRAMLGWGHEPHFEDCRDALIDLLADDCGPCYSCAKLAELMAENSQLRVKVDDLNRNGGKAAQDMDNGENVHMCPNDTREKLEADVRWQMGHFFAWDEKREEFVGYVLEWLNRQAAITEHNCKELVGAQAERIAELEELLQRTNRRISVQGSRIHALEAGSPTSECRACFDAMQEEKYRIKLERDEANTKKHELAAERDELMAENNALRAANDMKATESDVRTLGVDANDANVDTREKILADLEKLTHKWHDYHGNFMRIYNGVAYAQVKELLDRQTAITDAEWEDELEQLHMGYKPIIAELREDVAERDDVIAVLKAENADLQAKVDELTAQLEAAHAKNRALKAHIAKMQEGRHGWHVKGVELQHEVDRLTRENISLARDLGECMAERDSWRYRWHQVRVLMDEPLQCDRATLVDIDGEVAG